MKHLALLLPLALAACDLSVEITDLDGRNARNNAFRIQIDPDADCRPAVYAQELYEALLKRDPVAALEVKLDSSHRRQMEITGHEIEVQAAVSHCDADEAGYRASEAQTMHRGYDGLFRKMPAPAIEAAMLARKDKAARFIRDHRAEIEKHR